MKKSNLNQTKIYEVEIETFHGKRDEIIKMKVQALNATIAQENARKAFKETYGEYAESLIEIRDLTFIQFAN